VCAGEVSYFDAASRAGPSFAPGLFFPTMYLKTLSIFTQSPLRLAWALDTGGELTVSNGSIQFRDFTDAKHSFVFSVRDVRSVERRRGPEGFESCA